MWFTASLLFKCVDVLQPRKELNWEERIVLLQAQDEEEAQAIAESIGQKAALDPRDYNDDGITVLFAGVESLCELEGEPLESGTEIFSRFLRPTAARSLFPAPRQQVG